MKNKRTFLDKSTSADEQNKRNLLNKNVNSEKQNKKSLFKLLGVTSLASFMAVTGVLAFAPAVVGGNILFATPRAEMDYSTQGGGLIVPKEDDPVIFTTESGLEIRYGNALPDSYGDAILTDSSGLGGFPYFRTYHADGNTFAWWVIIGQSTDMFGVKGRVNVDNTPAGTAVKNDSKYGLEEYWGGWPFSKVVANEEIPANCVLIMSHHVLWTSTWYSSGFYANGNPKTFCYSAADVYGGQYNDFSNTLSALYTNDNFYFGTLKSKIQKTTLKHFGISTDTDNGNEADLSRIQIESYLFTLDINPGGSEAAVVSRPYSLDDYFSYCNFRFETYLTTEQFKLTSADHITGRSMRHVHWPNCYTNFGTNSWGFAAPEASHSTAEYGLPLGTMFSYNIRPACVFSLA